jgi:transcriptional regulator GlxA family with amidase domain
VLAEAVEEAVVFMAGGFRWVCFLKECLGRRTRGLVRHGNTLARIAGGLNAKEPTISAKAAGVVEKVGAGEFACRAGVLCADLGATFTRSMNTVAASENRRVVILIYPCVRELGVAGIVDVFSSANELLPEERRYRIEYVCTEKTPPSLQGMYGQQMRDGLHYSDFKGKIDTLIVPGGSGVVQESAKPALLKWLKKQAGGTRRVSSACIGAFLLAKAGVLNGRRATTHWAFAGQLAKEFPEVKVDPEPIWVRDGNVYTSAGGTSAIDLSLALLEEDHGRKIALEVARILVVFLCRPGGQSQFSASLKEQTTESRPLRDLQIWMLDHVADDLSVPALAAKVAMSERNFQRVFTREMGKSPAQYVEEIRIEAVRRKLERSTQGMEEIADACGFGSADVMGRSFARRLKVTPAEYRARFRSSGI